MDKKVKIALKQNFIPPSPQRRDTFVNSISMPKAKFSEVFLSQIGFIRKRVWFMFAICTCFAFYNVNTIEIGSNIISTVSAILPLFVLCATSEIYKSTSHNMGEMELVCKYNLSKIILMRTGILGTTSFVMLILFICITTNTDYGMVRSIIYLTVPFLLSSYLSLLIISRLHLKETVYICAGVCGSVSIFMLLASVNYNFIYDASITYIWVMAFFILSLLLVHCFIRFIKLQEELQWNLA